MANDEWNLLREVVHILTPFHEVSNEMEGSKYPTLSLVYPNVTLLRKHITVDTDDFAPSKLSMPAKKLCKLLLQQLDTRFPIENAATTIIMATYIDVRFKKLEFLDEAARLKWKARIDETIESMRPVPHRRCIHQHLLLPHPHPHVPLPRPHLHLFLLWLLLLPRFLLRLLQQNLIFTLFANVIQP
jgi:hypothetical protein